MKSWSFLVTDYMNFSVKDHNDLYLWPVDFKIKRDLVMNNLVFKFENLGSKWSELLIKNSVCVKGHCDNDHCDNDLWHDDVVKINYDDQPAALLFWGY